MKLYDSRRAPNPRRVRWFMAEKGIEDVEIIDVDLFAGDHREPDYLARAGFAHVPALTVDEGETITESIAICRYLEAVYPLPNMFGLEPWETAWIEMWTARNRQDAERALKVFDERLGQSEWLGAQRITMADGVLFIGLDFARLVKFQPPEDLVHLNRWLTAIRARRGRRAGA
jgi:glutathione S-transferase